MANGGIAGGLFPTVSRIPGFYGDVGPEGVPMTAGAYASLPGATAQPPDPSSLNMARAQQIAGRGMEQVNNVSGMRGLSDRQKAVAIGSVAGDVSRQGVDLDVSSATDQLRGLSARQQLGLSQSQYGASSAFGRSQGRGRRNRFDGGAMIGEQPEGYKDGGMVDDKAERLLRRMSDKYGISSEIPALPTGAPTVRESQTVPRGSEDADRRRGFRTAKRWREGGDYPIDVKYADGGIVAFKGKGGPREDKIPVTVAGEKIMVSNGEKAVILPAKTAANPAALGIIGGLIEQTNDGRKPKMGMRDGGKYARGAVPVRQYPDEIDIARGLMETENARAADAAARARAARAGAIVPVAAPDPYQPNWTQPRNVPAQFVRPAVEGVVETVADQRAASMAAHPKALNAPTGLVPPVSQPNWTAGGTPPNVGPVGGGQWANQGWNAPPGRATMPQGGGIQSAVQALPAPPHETVKAVNDARTSATARSAGRASNEAAAYANRPAFETSSAANVGPNAALAGKIVRRTIPVVGGAISAGNIADVATDPNKTGADVATQVAREAGGWGAAVAGGAAGAKVGSALGALGGPLAPITIPAGALIGGIGGGLAANYGANALMDLGGEAPAKTSNGVVSRLFGGNQQQAAVDPTRTKHNAILNSGAGTGEIRLPIDKRAAYANTAAVQSAAANQDAGATVRNGIVQADMGRGFDPTKLQMAPGYGMASNAAGKTIGGNMSPNQYVAADGTPNARWEETQQYKDAIARNERMKLELAEIQAGKKRGADPMAIQTAQQGIAGAMIGNQAKQEEMQRNDQSNALLKTAMNTKDPAQHRIALQNYLASRGVAMKDPDEWEIMAGGERSVPNGLGGFQVVKDPPIAFHKPTRQWIKADGSIGQDGGATQTAQQADDIKAQMQAGKITRDQAIAELRKIGYQ